MKKNLSITLLACSSILLSICGHAAAEEVNLYSARKEVLMKPLLDAFTSETGIKVNIISGKADALLTRIKREGINSPADVLLTTDAGRLHRAKLAGIFSPLTSEVLNSNVPAQDQDNDKQWVGLSIRVRHPDRACSNR